MDSNGFLVFAGILLKVLLFAASVFLTTFIVDLTSVGRRRWVPAAVIGAAILIFAIEPGLIISVLQSFSTGLSWKGFMLVILAGFAAGGVFSGI